MLTCVCPSRNPERSFQAPPVWIPHLGWASVVSVRGKKHSALFSNAKRLKYYQCSISLNFLYLQNKDEWLKPDAEAISPIICTCKTFHNLVKGFFFRWKTNPNCVRYAPPFFSEIILHIQGAFFNCSSQFSVPKWKILFSQRGAFLHWKFLEKDVLVGCNLFFILVLKIGRNS